MRNRKDASAEAEPPPRASSRGQSRDLSADRLNYLSRSHSQEVADSDWRPGRRLSPEDFWAPLLSCGPPCHTEKGQEALIASELQDRALTQGHQALDVSSIRLFRASTCMCWG